jgi:hypothetical protein
LDFNIMQRTPTPASTAIITPRLFYALAVLGLFTLAIIDHLNSPALSNLGAPTELGNACAPCGAPCIDEKPK